MIMGVALNFVYKSMFFVNNLQDLCRRLKTYYRFKVVSFFIPTLPDFQCIGKWVGKIKNKIKSH